jgi:hypothetical protein
VYDFALSDGTFVSHKASYLTEEMKSKCIGVVYWLDSNGEELGKDTALKAAYPDCNHGLIVSLNYLTYNSSDLIAWQGPKTTDVYSEAQSTGKSYSSYQSIQLLCTSYDPEGNLLLLLDYNNTQVLIGHLQSYRTDNTIVHVANAIYADATKVAGTNLTPWCIPSLYGLVYMSDYLNPANKTATYTTTKLNAAFEKLGEGNYTPIKNGSDAIHWTGFEVYSAEAWAFKFDSSLGDGYIQQLDKTTAHYVRPVCIF